MFALRCSFAVKRLSATAYIQPISSYSSRRSYIRMIKKADPVRLAILECDTPLPNTKENYGGYGGVFEALLKAGAKSKGITDFDSVVKISKYNVEDDPETYPDPQDVDALLLTGSRHDSFADAPWIVKLVDYTKMVLSEQKVRIIGVCFGHQIIARALGVKVGRNPDGWEAAVNDVQLSSKGKEIFGVDKLRLHQMHRDIAFYYPEGVEQLGSSPVCKVQGMYTPRHLLTVQGHPEFNEPIMKEILETRHQTGIFDDDAYNAHIKKVSLPHDGVTVSAAFLDFLLDD